MVEPATVHAIVGENGAGKSTLMKILYGMQRPDAGEVVIEGERRSFRSPKDAIAAGVGMVHQHFMLADNLTVLENVILGEEPKRLGVISHRDASERVGALARRYGLSAGLDEPVEQLGVGDRQRVEIIKVLYRGARILILDEPTAVLVPQEVEALFANLAELKAGGVTVLFISHKLDEVLRVADAITVMRAGRTVASVAPSEVTRGSLAELMVGSALPTPETTTSTVTDQVELALRGVTVTDAGGRDVLSGIDLQVRRGEIVGIAGVEGNGQRELVDVILGLLTATSGRVELRGEDITDWPTRRRREEGIGYIPEDRQRTALLVAAPLWENVVLGHQTQAPYASGPWIDRGAARRRTAEVIDRFGVRTPGPDVSAYALSGGNQQKLVVGREMLAGPTVLIAAHPTRGIDVGAQADVWEELRQARAAGLAVLLLSADLEELIGLSDTLRVIFGGRLVAELDPARATPELLGSHMTGARSGERS